MAVTVQLNDGVELRVEVGLDAMREAYQAALSQDGLLEIRSLDGRTRAVNPHQILYFEEAEAADPDETEATTTPPVREPAGSH